MENTRTLTPSISQPPPLLTKIGSSRRNGLLRPLVSPTPPTRSGPTSSDVFMTLREVTIFSRLAPLPPKTPLLPLPTASRSQRCPMMHFSAPSTSLTSTSAPPSSFPSLNGNTSVLTTTPPQFFPVYPSTLHPHRHCRKTLRRLPHQSDHVRSERGW
jgi:hypothetical protein